jgi:hypothetical protein
MAFTYVNGNSISASSTPTVTVTVTGAVPVQGDLLIASAMVIQNSGTFPATLSVKDSNGNAYTLSPSSPATGGATNKVMYMAYLVAPSSVTTAVTFTFSTSISTAYCCVEHFSPNGGVVAFDKDSAAANQSGTTINGPSLTPSQSGELLYTFAYSSQLPTAAGSGWSNTNNTRSGIVFDEYMASSGSTATTPGSLSGVSSGWYAMMLAFSLGAATPKVVSWNGLLIKSS